MGKKYTSKVTRGIDYGSFREEIEVGSEWSEEDRPMCNYCGQPAVFHFIPDGYPEGYLEEEFICNKPECMQMFVKSIATQIREIEDEEDDLDDEENNW